jgi:hypothetical protein
MSSGMPAEADSAAEYVIPIALVVGISSEPLAGYELTMVGCECEEDELATVSTMTATKSAILRFISDHPTGELRHHRLEQYDDEVLQ